MKRILAIIFILTFIVSGCSEAAESNPEKSSSDNSKKEKEVLTLDYSKQHQAVLGLVNYDEVYEMNNYLANLRGLFEELGIDYREFKNDAMDYFESRSDSWDEDKIEDLEAFLDFGENSGDYLYLTEDFVERYGKTIFEPQSLPATYKKSEDALYFTIFCEKGTDFTDDCNEDKEFTTYSPMDYIGFVESEIKMYGDLKQILDILTTADHFNAVEGPFYKTKQQAEVMHNEYEKVLDLVTAEKKFTKEVYEAIHSTEVEGIKFYFTQLGLGYMDSFYDWQGKDYLNYVESDDFQNLSDEEKKEFIAMYTSWEHAESYDLSLSTKVYFLHDLSIIDVYESLMFNEKVEFLSEEDQKNLKDLHDAAIERFLYNYDDFSSSYLFQNTPVESYFGDMKNYFTSVQENKSTADDLEEYYEDYIEGHRDDLFDEQYGYWFDVWLEEQNAHDYF